MNSLEHWWSTNGKRLLEEHTAESSPETESTRLVSEPCTCGVRVFTLEETVSYSIHDFTCCQAIKEAFEMSRDADTSVRPLMREEFSAKKSALCVIYYNKHARGNTALENIKRPLNCFLLKPSSHRGYSTKY